MLRYFIWVLGTKLGSSAYIASNLLTELTPLLQRVTLFDSFCCYSNSVDLGLREDRPHLLCRRPEGRVEVCGEGRWEQMWQGQACFLSAHFLFYPPSGWVHQSEVLPNLMLGFERANIRPARTPKHVFLHMSTHVYYAWPNKLPHSLTSGWFNDFLLVTHVRGAWNIFGDFLWQRKVVVKGQNSFQHLNWLYFQF